MRGKILHAQRLGNVLIHESFDLLHKITLACPILRADLARCWTDSRGRKQHSQQFQHYRMPQELEAGAATEDEISETLKAGADLAIRVEEVAPPARAHKPVELCLKILPCGKDHERLVDRIPGTLQFMIAASRRIQGHDSTETGENFTLSYALLLPALVDLVDDPTGAVRMHPSRRLKMRHPGVSQFKNGLGESISRGNISRNCHDV
ncbi:MAG: hypothetical protein ACOYNN_11850 [Terrimicrobiaceae bacterium]